MQLFCCKLDKINYLFSNIVRYPNKNPSNNGLVGGSLASIFKHGQRLVCPRGVCGARSIPFSGD